MLLSNLIAKAKLTSSLKRRKLEGSERLQETRVSVNMKIEHSVCGVLFDCFVTEISMFGYGSMGEKRTVVCQVGNFPVRYKYHEGVPFCIFSSPGLLLPLFLL